MPEQPEVPPELLRCYGTDLPPLPSPSSLPPPPTSASWSWVTLTSAEAPAASDRDNAEFVISRPLQQQQGVRGKQ